LGTLQGVKAPEPEVVDELFDVHVEALTDDLGDAVRGNLGCVGQLGELKF